MPDCSLFPAPHKGTQNMKMSNYERVKKWRAENKEKHRLQWERYYRDNHDAILERKRNKYKLKKQNEPIKQDTD